MSAQNPGLRHRHARWSTRAQTGLIVISLSTLLSQAYDFSSAKSFRPGDHVPSPSDVEAWLKQQGAVFHGVHLTRLPGFGYSLVATRQLQAADSVLIVPSNLAISGATLSSCPASIALTKHLQSPPPGLAGKILPLVAFLLYHAGQPSSKWQTYVNALPACTPHPLTFGAEALAIIEGSEMSAKLQKSKRVIQRFAEIIRQIAGRTTPLFASNLVTTDAVIWAFCAFATRAYAVDMEVKDGVKERALLPGIDFANHWSKYEGPHLNSTDGHFYLSASKPIRGGEQVFVSYSDDEMDIHHAMSFGMSPLDTALQMQIILADILQHTDPITSDKALAASLTAGRCPINRDTGESIQVLVHKSGLPAAFWRWFGQCLPAVSLAQQKELVRNYLVKRLQTYQNRTLCLEREVCKDDVWLASKGMQHEKWAIRHCVRAIAMIS